MSNNVIIHESGKDINYLTAFLKDNNVDFVSFVCPSHSPNSFSHFIENYLENASGAVKVLLIGCNYQIFNIIKSLTNADGDSLYLARSSDIIIDEFLVPREHENYVVIENYALYEGGEATGEFQDLTAKKLLEIFKPDTANIKSSFKNSVMALAETSNLYEKYGVKKR